VDMNGVLQQGGIYENSKYSYATLSIIVINWIQSLYSYLVGS